MLVSCYRMPARAVVQRNERVAGHSRFFKRVRLLHDAQHGTQVPINNVQKRSDSIKRPMMWNWERKKGEEHRQDAQRGISAMATSNSFAECRVQRLEASKSTECRDIFISLGG